MKLVGRDALVENSVENVKLVHRILEEVPAVSLNEFDATKTMLVIVDMVNGFVKSGNMASKLIEDIVLPIVKLKVRCDKVGIETIAFADCHTKFSVELRDYPSHCIAGTKEEDIIDELKEVGVSTVIKKNSTNGFLEDEFLQLLNKNDSICNFVVVGCCTDICVQNFALTLKMWFNKENKVSRIVVPMDAVQTYNAEGHDVDVYNIIALDTMVKNGIEIVKRIE